MHFSSGFFGSLLTGSGKWNASLAARDFEFYPAGGKKKAIPYESIHGVRSIPGVMWSEVTIESSKGSVNFDGIGNSQAALLTALLRIRVADDLLAAIDPHRKSITNLSLANAAIEPLVQPGLFSGYVEPSQAVVFIVACFAGSLHSQPETPVSIEIAVPDRHMQGWLFREPIDAFVKRYDQQPTAGQDDLAVPKLKKNIGKQQDKHGTGS